MAVGVSVRDGAIDEFRERLSKTISDKYGEDFDFSPKVNISLTLDSGDVGFELLDELELLHPFGEGNKEPVFALCNIVLTKEPEPFGAGQNFRFQIPLANGGWINAVAWRFANNVPPVGKPVDFAIKLGWNRWNRRKSPQATLIDWRFSE
jgi:single-stranded-DNA-specific exonuclease